MMRPRCGVFVFVASLVLVAMPPGIRRSVAGDHYGPYGPFPYGLKHHLRGDFWAQRTYIGCAGPIAPLESVPCGPLTPPYWQQLAPSEWVKPERPYRELSWYNQTPVGSPTSLNCSCLGSGACCRNPWYPPSPAAVEADVQAAHGPYLAPYIHTDR
jgi:hypothetical protein